MTEFKTDISENGKKFELVFQTDNKAYFEKMQATARECIDHKPVTQFDRIKAMSIDELAMFISGICDYEYESPVYNEVESGKHICGDFIPDYNEDNIKKWLESEVSEC